VQACTLAPFPGGTGRGGAHASPHHAFTGDNKGGVESSGGSFKKVHSD